jgi:hypothetical protein
VDDDMEDDDEEGDMRGVGDGLGDWEKGGWMGRGKVLNYLWWLSVPCSVTGCEWKEGSYISIDQSIKQTSLLSNYSRFASVVEIGQLHIYTTVKHTTVTWLSDNKKSILFGKSRFHFISFITRKTIVSYHCISFFPLNISFYLLVSFYLFLSFFSFSSPLSHFIVSAWP